MKITKRSRKYFGNLNFLKYKPMSHGRPKGMLLINNFPFYRYVQQFQFPFPRFSKKKKNSFRQIIQNKFNHANDITFRH